MGANDRTFRVKSDQVINVWTYAEMGEKLAKKFSKKDMRRYKRNLEKQALKKEDAK